MRMVTRSEAGASKDREQRQKRHAPIIPLMFDLVAEGFTIFPGYATVSIATLGSGWLDGLLGDDVPNVTLRTPRMLLELADGKDWLHDGAIWVADDRNAAILRIAVDRP